MRKDFYSHFSAALCLLIYFFSLLYYRGFIISFERRFPDVSLRLLPIIQSICLSNLIQADSCWGLHSSSLSRLQSFGFANYVNRWKRESLGVADLFFPALRRTFERDCELKCWSEFQHVSTHVSSLFRAVVELRWILNVHQLSICQYFFYQNRVQLIKVPETKL